MPEQNKPMLMDVVLMRLGLIFFLVVYHALCIYTGGWEKPFDSFPDIPLYDWLGMSTHGFRLQSMVLISGLLFGHTLKKHPERLCFNSCVVRKAKRVLLPCYIFGIVYWLMFYYQSNVDIRIIGGGYMANNQWYRPFMVSTDDFLVFCDYLHA